MRDRLSELLDLAQRERLTPEDSEELARMLNAPVMAPMHAAAGFVSKPTDLPRRIKAICWFSRCGEPLALDLSMQIESWSAAMEACQSLTWEYIELEASNQLTMCTRQN